MKHVYIAQLKCPSNHCVVALAGEYRSQEQAELLLRPVLLARFMALVRHGTVKRECGICHSTNLHVQVARTRFATMEEARPFLYESQAQQVATAEMLRQGRN